jgi:hypothetical protein
MGRSFKGVLFVHLLVLVERSCGAVPASNSIQASILSQQAYNLCLYEKYHDIQTATATCEPFGVSGMPPVQTVVVVNRRTSVARGTFFASFLSEYGGLECPGTTITTTDSYGKRTTLPIGELGQGETDIPLMTSQEGLRRRTLNILEAGLTFYL